MQDYTSSRVKVMILVKLVNAQTHTQTDNVQLVIYYYLGQLR